MKITLSQIYNNRPHYTIKHDNGKTNHSLGYEQTKTYIESARTKEEKIEVGDTKFLDEHNKLIELIKSNPIKRRKNEKEN